MEKLNILKKIFFKAYQKKLLSVDMDKQVVFCMVDPSKLFD